MIEKVLSSVEEYNKVLDARDVNARNTEVGRQPLEGDMVKLNTDTAVFSDGSVGCGEIMRDSKGAVLGATCVSVEGRYDIDVAEAFAARHAMKISLEAGLNRLILESDYLKLISYLKRGVIESSSFGFLVADINCFVY